jgi:hypothetical protein
MTHIAAKGLILIASLLGTQAALAVGPDSFAISNVIYAGSGCPAGSVASDVAPDRAAFTLLFDNYVAEAGPGISLSAGRKNCQLNITFQCTPGWQFALVDLDTRGYAALDPGVNGTQKTIFYFQGDANQGSVQRDSHGPVDGDYQVRDTIPVSSRTWGLCGAHARSLNINTQVRIDNSRNRNGQGLLTVDSIDGSLSQIFGIVWQRTAN